MSTLTVVYMQSTRNVLAALTRAAPPGPGEPVTALVGTSLPVRAVGATSTQMAIPASALATVTVNDTQPDAVLDPQAFQVVDDPKDNTVHLVTSIPPGTTSTPKIALTLNTTAGAVVKVTGPTGTVLPLVAVLQKVTKPPQAATIIGPVNLIISSGSGSGSGSASLTAAPGSELAGATWDLAAFTPGILPQATSASL